MRTRAVKHCRRRADQHAVGRLAGALALAAVLVAGLTGGRTAAAAAGPHPEPTAPPVAVAAEITLPPHPGAADLARLHARIAVLTELARQQAHGVDEAAGRLAALRVTLAQARRDCESARARLTLAVRAAHEATGGLPVAQVVAGWQPGDEEVTHVTARRSVAAVSSALDMTARTRGGGRGRPAAGARAPRRDPSRRGGPASSGTRPARARHTTPSS